MFDTEPHDDLEFPGCEIALKGVRPTLFSDKQYVNVTYFIYLYKYIRMYAIHIYMYIHTILYIQIYSYYSRYISIYTCNHA